MKRAYITVLIIYFTVCNATAQNNGRVILNFDRNWLFNFGDVNKAELVGFDDAKWRRLDLPHDWSIEQPFKKDDPAGSDEASLPCGIGWYRKTFRLPQADRNKLIYISFDGIYQCSNVWINGHHLGFRPNGYISFRYELTKYLNYGGKSNAIAVKVDNSLQPNSRYYTGSGIYRHVWLIKTNKTAIDNWGSFVTTPVVSVKEAAVTLQLTIKNSAALKKAEISTTIYDAQGNKIGQNEIKKCILDKQVSTLTQHIILKRPHLWSTDNPYLYKIITRIISKGSVLDKYETPLGVRYYSFDPDKGFSLNGKRMKIYGVCQHHDIGALGAVVNARAIERQLKLLKAMGCNAIRTTHNPPAPDFLELTDKLGFIVLDEAFDCWNIGKKKYDYALYFTEWHKPDLEDQVLRDRNHPSVFMWSIGNEIPKQNDTSLLRITRELTTIIHNLDTTHPVTAANHQPGIGNQIIASGALDLIGWSYNHLKMPEFQKLYPGKNFIATETTSATETRGTYNMPSDSIRMWKPKKGSLNADYTMSAYDNATAASTHEDTWKIIKKYDFMSGLFIWTGFDYLGEPAPFYWPARSAYFGVIDLAGFPKDEYYMYQSEWSKKNVLHIFPHWNWERDKIVDVWVYYNNADEVELYVNGRSVGVKKKIGDDLHLMWRLKFEPGTIKAVSRKNGKMVLTTQVKTAGKAAKIELIADRKIIKADAADLSFVTARIVDKDGNLVPDASNTINFKLRGQAEIAATDNGYPADLTSFQSRARKAFNGLALAIIKAKNKAGKVSLTASSDGLAPSGVELTIIK